MVVEGAGVEVLVGVGSAVEPGAAEELVVGEADVLGAFDGAVVGKTEAVGEAVGAPSVKPVSAA
jgi:hypothetical protein